LPLIELVDRSEREDVDAGVRTMWGLLVATIVALGEPSTSSLSTVSVDLRAIDRQDYDAIGASDLYKSLVVRLVGEGLAFVNDGEASDIRVQLARPTPGVLDIAVLTHLGSHRASIPFSTPGTEQQRLAIIHAALGLVRQARVELLTPPQAVAAPPVVDVLPAAQVAAPTAWDVGPDAGASMLKSADSWGLLTHLGAAVRREVFAFEAYLAVHQPAGLPSALDVLEGGAFVGAAVRSSVMVPWLDVEAGLYVGAWHQRFTYRDAAGHTDSGVRWDAAATGQVSLEATVAQRMRLGVHLGGLMNLHERAHRTATELLWRSPQLRPFVGLSAGLTL
jgi:hypothetical protein